MSLEGVYSTRYKLLQMIFQGLSGGGQGEVKRALAARLGHYIICHRYPRLFEVCPRVVLGVVGSLLELFVNESGGGVS